MRCETSERATVRKAGGRLVIHVSWHDAASLQTHLRRKGFLSVPLLGAGKREICLELESDPDEASVHAAIADWAGCG
jgi:hypothetical protein